MLKQVQHDKCYGAVILNSCRQGGVALTISVRDGGGILSYLLFSSPYSDYHWNKWCHCFPPLRGGYNFSNPFG